MKYLGVAAAVAAAVSACATVTRGTTNKVQIFSEPSGAQVITSLNHTCTTPCTLTLNRKDEISVKFVLAGYKEAIVEVRTQLAGTGALGVAGNALVGGVIGVGVDVATGSALEHIPNPVQVTLEKTDLPSRSSSQRRLRGRSSEPAADAAPANEITPPPPPAPKS